MSSAIRIHPDNPKSFEFRGKPLMLLTATEHYGAVINRPFRFERYLADAAEKGITLTCLFMLFREQQTTPAPDAPGEQVVDRAALSTPVVEDRRAMSIMRRLIGW